jgi:hypothetical protein
VRADQSGHALAASGDNSDAHDYLGDGGLLPGDGLVVTALVHDISDVHG